jgi:threonine/homoserine/homoserine lactone efflux protein
VHPALLEFGVAATLLILAPGPDSMLVLRNALRGGPRAGLSTAAGTITGLLSWAVAAALGISALLEASRIGYDALRLAGGAYLVWLGFTSLRGRRSRTPVNRPPGAAEGPKTSPHVKLRRAYLNGVISNACNPKIGIFFIAFLPSVMPTGVPARQFSLVLGAWFAVETGLWLAAVVWMAEHAKRWLDRPRWQRRLEQVTGVVLIGFGIRLATERRIGP